MDLLAFKPTKDALPFFLGYSCVELLSGVRSTTEWGPTQIRVCSDTIREAHPCFILRSCAAVRLQTAWRPDQVNKDYKEGPPPSYKQC